MPLFGLTRRWGTLALLVALLAACGGGGGGETSGGGSATVEPTPTVGARLPTPIAAPAPTTGAASARPRGDASVTALPNRPPPPSTGSAATRTVANSVTAPGEWGPTLAPLIGGQTYSDPQGRFTIAVPADWTQRPAAEAGAEVSFDAPDNVVRMNVALRDAAALRLQSVEAFDQALDEALKRQYPTYQIVSLERVVVDNQRAYRRVFTIDRAGQPLQGVQIYFVKGATAYTIAFTATPDAFAGLAPALDAIAGSCKARE